MTFELDLKLWRLRIVACSLMVLRCVSLWSVLQSLQQCSCCHNRLNLSRMYQSKKRTYITSTPYCACYMRTTSVILFRDLLMLYHIFVCVFLSSDINECDNNTCMNGATCVDEVNGYNCTCAVGYTGDRCETGRFEHVCNAGHHRTIWVRTFQMLTSEI